MFTAQSLLTMIKEKYMGNEINRHSRFTRRSLVIGLTKISLFAALVYRFFSLQVLNHGKFKTLSTNNRLRVHFTSPIRGKILTHNNVIIATNRVRYSLVLKNKKKASQAVVALNRIIAPQKIQANFNQKNKQGSIRLLENVDSGLVRILRANPNLKYITVIKEHVRYYPFGTLLFHVLGYTKVVKDSYQNKGQRIIGNGGVEKIFNNKLSGIRGVEKTEVNARGQFVRSLDIVKPQESENLLLSIDIEIQKIISKIMRDRIGSAIVYDLNKMCIAALHSSPSVDGNALSQNLSQNEWEKILEGKNNPFVNRAVAALYNPGSTFKIVLYLAILFYNIAPDEEILCPGYFRLGNQTYRCHKKFGHGLVKLDRALSESCNVYYYKKSLQLGINRIKNIANKFGFGIKTGVELSGELAGVVPDQEWKMRRFNKKWYEGDTVNTSIGQGYVQATMIQLIQYISQVALNRKINVSILHDKSNKACEILFPEEHMVRLRSALKNSIKSNNIETLQIIGKTGTSQIISRDSKNVSGRYEDHSIFTGFTKKDKKWHSIALIVENGGWGSKTALPLAKRIITDIQYL